MAISNCVVNLSPDKPAVLASVFAALKAGGEFHFSDVFVDRRLSAAVRAHHTLVRVDSSFECVFDELADS